MSKADENEKKFGVRYELKEGEKVIQTWEDRERFVTALGTHDHGGKAISGKNKFKGMRLTYKVVPLAPLSEGGNDDGHAAAVH